MRKYDRIQDMFGKALTYDLRYHRRCISPSTVVSVSIVQVDNPEHAFEMTVHIAGRKCTEWFSPSMKKTFHPVEVVFLLQNLRPHLPELSDEIWFQLIRLGEAKNENAGK